MSFLSLQDSPSNYSAIHTSSPALSCASRSSRSGGSYICGDNVSLRTPCTPSHQEAEEQQSQQKKKKRRQRRVDRSIRSPHFDPILCHPNEIKSRRKTEKEQYQKLEAAFRMNPKPNPQARKLLSERLGMTERRVQVWFQNRRAKERKMEKRKRDAIIQQGWLDDLAIPLVPQEDPWGLCCPTSQTHTKARTLFNDASPSGPESAADVYAYATPAPSTAFSQNGALLTPLASSNCSPIFVEPLVWTLPPAGPAFYDTTPHTSPWDYSCNEHLEPVNSTSSEPCPNTTSLAASASFTKRSKQKPNLTPLKIAPNQYPLLNHYLQMDSLNSAPLSHLRHSEYQPVLETPHESDVLMHLQLSPLTSEEQSMFCALPLSAPTIIDHHSYFEQLLGITPVNSTEVSSR
jgi:hypothetical protein